MRNYHPNVIPYAQPWRPPRTTVRKPTQERRADTYLKGAALVHELRRWYSPQRPFFEGDLANKWGELPEWAPLSAIAMQFSNVLRQPVSIYVASQAIRSLIPDVPTKQIYEDVRVTGKIKRKRNETWFRIGGNT